MDYLLEGANQRFPSAQLKPEDVISSWAGLRPLIHEDGKSASELSRKDEIFISESGLMSIAGGKLTGYRKMAQRIVDLVARKLQVKNPCRTDSLVLCGGGFQDAKEVNEYRQSLKNTYTEWGIMPKRVEYLVANYGKQTEELMQHFDKDAPSSPDEKLGLAELMFALDKEMVMSPLDFFVRRTGGLYFDIARVRSLAEPVVGYMEDYFEWTPKQKTQELQLLNQALYEASHFPI